MNLRPHKSRSVDINMTPLIDVVFLLLIFFMVSTTFTKERLHTFCRLVRLTESHWRPILQF